MAQGLASKVAGGISQAPALRVGMYTLAMLCDKVRTIVQGRLHDDAWGHRGLCASLCETAECRRVSLHLLLPH